MKLQLYDFNTTEETRKVRMPMGIWIPPIKNFLVAPHQKKTIIDELHSEWDESFEEREEKVWEFLSI